MLTNDEIERRLKTDIIDLKRRVDEIERNEFRAVGVLITCAILAWFVFGCFQGCVRARTSKNIGLVKIENGEVRKVE